MSNYLTEKSEHTGEVSIFATPNKWYDPEEEGSLPFEYEFRGGTSHWNSKAVLVVTHEVTLPIPEGINLVQKAVETLHAKIAEKRADLAAEIAELEEQISKLSLLTYEPTPEGEHIVVELGPGYDGEEDVIIHD